MCIYIHMYIHRARERAISTTPPSRPIAARAHEHPTGTQIHIATGTYVYDIYIYDDVNL